MIPASSDIYETARAEVEQVINGEAVGLVARVLGRVSAQIAMSRAICQVAGNALARMTDHAEAEALHRQRAAYHRERAVRAMPIGKRR